MATRKTYNTSRFPFVADRDSLDHDSGHTIDWANVNVSFQDATGKKYLPAGTVMGELLSGNGSISPRALTTNPATCILATDAHEGSEVSALSGFGVILGGVIYENLLPEATGTPKTLPAAVKTELQTAGVGTGYSFKQYVDSTS